MTVLGDDLGLIALGVTYSLKRADSPGNYTSLLHLGPLASVFADTELTGRTLELARLSNGTFLLSITS